MNEKLIRSVNNLTAAYTGKFRIMPTQIYGASHRPTLTTQASAMLQTLQDRERQGRPRWMWEVQQEA